MNQEGILSIRSVLESCLERERMSIRLYDRALEIVKGQASLQILQKLRREEGNHARLLTGALEGGGIDVLGQKELSGRLFVAPKAEPTLAEGSSPGNVIAFAVRHEERSIEYYSRYLDAFRGTELGELFARLRGEEEAHREKLLQMAEKIRE